MNARKILLLLIVLASGLSIELAWRARRMGFGPTACFVFRGNFEGPSFSYDDQGSLKGVPESPTVSVENEFGSVKVRRGEAGVVRVVLKKVVFLADEHEARKVSDQVRLQLTLDDRTVKVGTNRSEVAEHAGRDVGFETNLEIEAPPGTALRLTNGHGAVAVENVAGLDLTSAHGDVTVEDVTGSAIVRASHGDVHVARVGGELDAEVRHGPLDAETLAGPAKISLEHGDLKLDDLASARVELKHGQLTARNVKGPVEVRGEHAEVELSDVAGAVVVETSFRSVRLERVAGDARVTTSHGAINASDIGGAVVATSRFAEVELATVSGGANVDVAHGSLTAHDVHGDLSVKIEGGRAEIERFGGSVTVDSRHGEVSLTTEALHAQSVTVTTDHGAIGLTLPRGGHFALDASAPEGSVEADYPGLETTTRERGRLIGKVAGGGTPIRLEARHGDIHLDAQP